jgi:hypothetical protein
MTNLKYKIYYNSVFQIKVWLRRKINNLLKFNRPTNFPFITGDNFRSLAQHFFDDISYFNTDDICEGDIVFVRSDMLHTFFRKVNPKIKNKYVLISHNADNNIDNKYLKYNKDNIIHWYAQNLLIEDEKISPIPIGLSNFRYHKINKIFMAFDSGSNPKRKIIEKLLTPLKNVSKLNYMDKDSYYKNISSYNFIASPEGNGIDCHRTWETMYLKSVPILERNVTTDFYYKIGLPVLLIDSWDEIKNMDEKYLENKYNELYPKFSNPALYMDYWINNIINH